MRRCAIDEMYGRSFKVASIMNLKLSCEERVVFTFLKRARREGLLMVGLEQSFVHRGVHFHPRTGIPVCRYRYFDYPLYRFELQFEL